MIARQFHPDEDASRSNGSSPPAQLVRFQVRFNKGQHRIIWVNPDDISRLVEFADETLLVLRSEAAATSSEAGRSTYVVPGRIDRVAARINGAGAAR